MELQEYQTADGVSPFAEWFDGLHAAAAAKVTTALTRLGLGNVSKVKGVGAAVFEVKIDFGLGYRVYFGRDGDEIVILVGGGTKKKQDRDIEDAKDRWQDYKVRKRAGT